MSRVIPCLWFDHDAREAAEFYVSLFDDARMVWVQEFSGSDTYTLCFELAGREYYGLNSGGAQKPSQAFSMFVEVDTQDEIDRLWDALTADGGEPGPCGWLTDRWGISWQIVPRRIWELYASTDAEAVGRAMQAMMTMGKLDVAALEAAYAG